MATTAKLPRTLTIRELEQFQHGFKGAQRFEQENGPRRLAKKLRLVRKVYGNHPYVLGAEFHLKNSK